MILIYFSRKLNDAIVNVTSEKSSAYDDFTDSLNEKFLHNVTEMRECHNKFIYQTRFQMP